MHHFRIGIVPHHDLLLPGPIITTSHLSKDFHKKIIFYLCKISIYLRAKQNEELFKTKDDVEAYAKRYALLD